MKDFADGTHEARAALVLSGARVTPREQRIVLLQFANPVQRGLRTGTTRRRGLGILPGAGG